MKGMQEGQSPYSSGDVPVKCVGFMLVSSTSVRGPGTVCTGAQREPVKVELLGAQPSRKESSPIQRLKPIYSSPVRYAHVKRPIWVQLPVLQPTNMRFILGRRTAFLTNSGGRYKRHAARIDMVSATSAATSTPTSTGTRVGAIERPQKLYPRIPIDWVASLMRENQPRPRPLQRSSNQSEQPSQSRLLPWRT